MNSEISAACRLPPEAAEFEHTSDEIQQLKRRISADTGSVHGPVVILIFYNT
jgi:hypothetical protein